MLLKLKKEPLEDLKIVCEKNAFGQNLKNQKTIEKTMKQIYSLGTRETSFKGRKTRMARMIFRLIFSPISGYVLTIYVSKNLIEIMKICEKSDFR